MAADIAPIDSAAAISGLLAHGLDSSIIASALNVPVSVVESRRKTVTRLTPEDEDLANGIRRFAWRALREAEWIMEFGTTEAKLTLVRTVLPGVTRLLGKGGEGEEEESRAAVSRIFDSMRVDTRALPIEAPSTTTPTTPLSDPDTDLDASAPTATPRTDDTD